MPAGSSGNWEFDGFKVMTAMRVLLAGDQPVPLTSEAFDTLVVLIENRDRVVTKDELLRTVWPDVEVEEGNLTQQIFLLRKALGENAQQPRYVVTIPGHGYRFTAQVNAMSDGAHAAAKSIEAEAAAPVAPRRHVTLIATGVAAVGVIVMMGFAFGSGWMSAYPGNPPVRFTSITKITESGKATMSAISRDGQYVAYIENDGDEYSLWVKQAAADGKTQLVAAQPRPLAHVSFSPDGKYVYFARRSPRSPMFMLSRVPTIGGLEVPVLEDVDSPVSFSPNGREFVFQRGADPESHIVIAAAEGGSQRILATRRFPLRFSVFAPDWSPDGKVIAAAVVDGNASQSIVLLPVDGADIRELYRTEDNVGRLRWLPDGTGLLTVITNRPQPRQVDAVIGAAIWRIDSSGRAERLTFDLTNYAPCCIDISANGSAVVGVVNTLVSDLWLTRADRLDAPRQLTWDHPVMSRHSWLPDNDTIVYRDVRGRLNAVHKDGRAFGLPLPDGQEAAGPVSACGDGRYIVFSTNPGRNIWRVTPDAGALLKLTSGFRDFNAACTPDGTSVLYATREPDHVSLRQVAIDGGQPTPLGMTDSYDVLPSPSGRLIYYATDQGPTRTDRWIVVSSTDHSPVFAVNMPDDVIPGMLPVWAPNDAGLDYVVTRNGVSNIWRQPLTGGQAIQITSFTSGRIFSFAWSPDGQWLSFASGVNRSDVVLMSDGPIATTR